MQCIKVNLQHYKIHVYVFAYNIVITVCFFDAQFAKLDCSPKLLKNMTAKLTRLAANPNDSFPISTTTIHIMRK